MWMKILAVGAGGFLGSVCRFLISSLPLSERSSFPLLTLAVNFLGAVAIGALAEIPRTSGSLMPTLQLFLKTGVCGGFTTFSTFSLETMELLQSGKTGMGILYAALSVGCCLLGVLLGQVLVQTLRSALQ